MIKVVFDYSNEQDSVKISEELLNLCNSACVSVLKNEGMEGEFEISLTITDKPTIQQINSSYRGIDKVTDVLSFPMSDEGEYPKNLDTGALVLGDIMICAERALEQADEFGHSPEREFGFLCAHSLLHLLGYDHVGSEEQAKVMESKQAKALSDINLNR